MEGIAIDTNIAIDIGNLTPAKQKTPYLLMVSATIILIMGIIGLIFFTTATIYQYYNPQFLHDISNNSNQYVHLNRYVIIQAILHIGIIISALLMIRLKKAGLYLFFFVFLALLGSELLFENNLIINYLIAGLILIFAIVLYYRGFK